MDKVGGSVEWVNDPHEFRILGAKLSARFFGPNAVSGISGQQGFNNRLFCSMVYLSDKVIGLFLRDANRFDIKRSAVDDRTRSAGGLDGHIDHGVQIERHKLWG